MSEIVVMSISMYPMISIGNFLPRFSYLNQIHQVLPDWRLRPVVPDHEPGDHQVQGEDDRAGHNEPETPPFGGGGPVVVDSFFFDAPGHRNRTW